MRVTIAVVMLLGGAAQAQQAQQVLTLDAALQQARARQPELRQARAQVEVSQARVEEARAPLLPQITGTASYARVSGRSSTFTDPNTGMTTMTTSASANQYNFGLAGRQLVWDFGQTTRRWDAAKATASAQEQSARATELQVALGVRSTFFAAREAKALVTVANETLANQQRHLAQIEGFVQVGTRPQIDLAQARTDLANARVQLIDAQNGYDVARAQLAQAIGLDAAADFDVSDESIAAVAGEDGPGDALLGEAVRARPDIAALEEEIRAQELTVKAVRGAYGPTINVTGSVGEGGPALDDLSNSWQVGANLTWPLFQGGQTRAQVREAEAAVTSLTAQRDALRQQVRLDVEQARLSVRASRELLVAQGEAVTNARERLKLAEGRYQTGVGNAVELGDAQVALTAALAGQAQADFRVAAARAALLRALGRP
jgi:outer membrane protein